MQLLRLVKEFRGKKPRVSKNQILLCPQTVLSIRFFSAPTDLTFSVCLMVQLYSFCTGGFLFPSNNRSAHASRSLQKLWVSLAPAILVMASSARGANRTGKQPTGTGSAPRPRAHARHALSPVVTRSRPYSQRCCQCCCDSSARRPRDVAAAGLCRQLQACAATLPNQKEGPQHLPVRRHRARTAGSGNGRGKYAMGAGFRLRRWSGAAERSSRK